MHYQWRDFRNGLMNELNRPHACGVFQAARVKHPCFGPFESPGSLVAWMLDYSTHPREDEDAALRAIQSSYEAGDEKAFWMALTALGLWPVLEWVFCRVRPRCETDHEAASEIWAALEGCLTDEAFWLEARIAKRLMLKLWCKAARSLQAESIEARRLEKLTAALPDSDQNSPFLCEPSSGEEPEYDSGELKDLASSLTCTFRLSEADADLVVRHAVAGDSLADLARERGVSHSMLRQRYSRAIRRLRETLPNSAGPDVTLSALRELGMRKNEAGAVSEAPNSPFLN